MKLILIGANGKMGQQMQIFLKEKDCKVVLIDKLNRNILENCAGDIILDFSSNSALDDNLKIAKLKKLPIVIGTTNHNETNLKLIKEYSKSIPIFLTYNFSIGFNLMLQFIKYFKMLNDGEFLITEKHHKTKKDIPSGSAKMIIKKFKTINIEPKVYSYRVSNIVGEHKIYCYKDNEVLEIKHIAKDRMLFCDGAYKVCEYMLNKKKGFYTMEDFLKIDCK